MKELIVAFIKSPEVLRNMEMLLRILIAVLCGGFIGYERTNRGKGAGIRTHTIVAVASCLMMIVSQYGFESFLRNFSIPNIDMKFDPARVAAQIVPGIGFLGAGMIFIQRNNVMGLTTAAGIWGVAGIGMAIGGGMYFMGIICTVIIVIVQILTHKSSKFFRAQTEEELTFLLEDTEGSISSILHILNEFKLNIHEISYVRKDGDILEVTVAFRSAKNIKKDEVLHALHKEESIKMLKI